MVHVSFKFIHDGVVELLEFEPIDGWEIRPDQDSGAKIGFIRILLLVLVVRECI